MKWRNKKDIIGFSTNYSIIIWKSSIFSINKYSVRISSVLVWENVRASLFSTQWRQDKSFTAMLRFIEAYPNYRTLGIQAGIYKGSFDEDECAVDVDSDESQLVNIFYFRWHIAESWFCILPDLGFFSMREVLNCALNPC